jgi:hypothetical protein
MKTLSVGLESLLGQISEEQINRVVDQDALRAGGYTPPTSCHEGDDDEREDDERCRSEKEKCEREHKEKEHKEHGFCG